MSSILAPPVSTVRRGATASRHGEEVLPLGLVAVLTIGTLLLHLSQLHQSLFGDELWTFQQVSGRSLSGMFHAIRPPGENAPPLFFLMAWASAKLGDPTILIRLPSLILGAATVPVVYLLGRETVGRQAGLIGAAAFALSPFATYYGIEARPYATVTFFVVLSSVALVKAVRTRSTAWWALYSLAAAAAAYTSYPAIFVLMAEAVWSLWACRDRLREPVLANLVVAVLYLPWLPNVGEKGLAIIGVLEPFRLHNVLGDLLRAIAGYPYAPLNAIPTIPGLVVIAVCALAGIAALARRRSAPHSHPAEPGGLRLIGAIALATPVGIALYSLFSTDIWDARDLYSSLPAALLVLGALLAAIPFTARMVALAAVLASLVIGTIRAIGPYSRPAFRVAAEYLDRVAPPRDPIILYPSILGLDADIPAQFRRAHLVVNGAPRRWPSAPPGGEAFAVLDGYVTGPGHVPVPRPSGYVLLKARQYTGLVPFAVVAYRRA